MRLFALVVMVLTLASVASGGGGQTVRAHGMELTLPAGWHRVASAGDSTVIDPRTLLVVGTTGVAAKSTRCQIGAYHVPPSGAVVVIITERNAACASSGIPSPEAKGASRA